MKNESTLESEIKINFKNKSLLKQALVHRSYLNENPKFELPHNERLEFLGDAVLELSVTEYLYSKYQNPEGELTNWRASLVNSVNLAKVARLIGLEDYLYLSKGESKEKNTKARNYILANALEALIGSIYIDQGYKTASKFIQKWILSGLNDILENKLYVDPKTKFQEMSQEKLGFTPTYKVLKEHGPDHNKQFTVAILIENQEIAQGSGTSKQEAETEAARLGLKIKEWD